MITRYRSYLAIAGFLILASTAPAQNAVPSEIQVPQGHVEFLRTAARGTQNYMCLPAASGVAWKFFAPQATLFLNYRVGSIALEQQVMTHFLSANPEEDGTLRPTWQASFDTSAVWAKAIATSTDPNYVAAGAIPWLLLEITGHQRGPMNGNYLSVAKYIQRVNTSGGVAPSSGCAGPADIGKLALVPYTTDYVFYRFANGK